MDTHLKPTFFETPEATSNTIESTPETLESEVKNLDPSASTMHFDTELESDAKNEGDGVNKKPDKVTEKVSQTQWSPQTDAIPLVPELDDDANDLEVEALLEATEEEHMDDTSYPTSVFAFSVGSSSPLPNRFQKEEKTEDWRLRTCDDSGFSTQDSEEPIMLASAMVEKNLPIGQGPNNESFYHGKITFKCFLVYNMFVPIVTCSLCFCR
ncbi:unnamed protein product [Owenia fusiformis]|uniref:Uncharacterized protein n=1 Tax=Owenia fusiformis TaxID=6347 RepID=A0A8J1TE27_OWEFU|nr:unnamed protein product [Owenia fusiformis]